MIPREVSNVAVYFFFGSICIAGALLYCLGMDSSPVKGAFKITFSGRKSSGSFSNLLQHEFPEPNPPMPGHPLAQHRITRAQSKMQLISQCCGCEHHRIIGPVGETRMYSSSGSG